MRLATGFASEASSPEALVLLGRLVRVSGQFPVLMVPVEFATVGPLLNLMIGGRSGADRYRAALRLDTEEYIPLYQATLGALLRPVPGRDLLDGLVVRAVEHDLRENANLRAALDELDPPAGAPPRVHAATRYTAPAAAHAAAKFLLLGPAVLPACAGAAALALGALQIPRAAPSWVRGPVDPGPGAGRTQRDPVPAVPPNRS